MHEDDRSYGREGCTKQKVQLTFHKWPKKTIFGVIFPLKSIHPCDHESSLKVCGEKM